MAKVSLDSKAPQISRPVGSLDELRELGVPTRNISTCSERDGNNNAGCPMWYACDRTFRDTRPHMQIGRITTRDGRVRTSCGPCFNWLRKELDADEKGNLVEIIGGEGDTYTYRGSVKRHPVRDPNCNYCAQGKCDLWDDVDNLTAVCPEFPKAATHPELIMFAHKVRAKVETGVQKKESIRQQLYGPDEPKEKDKGGKRS